MKKEKILLLLHFICLVLISLYGNKLSFIYLIVPLVYYTLFKVGTKESIRVLLIITIAIPYGGELNSLYQIKGIKFSEIMILCYVAIIVLKKIASNKGIRNIKLLDVLISIFVISLIINLFTVSNNIAEGIKETKMLMIPIFMYFIIRLINYEFSIENILDILIKSTGIATIISLFIYHFANPEELGLIATGNRYGLAFYSLFIFTIPYILHKLQYENRKNKMSIIYFFILLSQIYAILLSQNRSILISIVVIILIDFIISIFKNVKNYMDLAKKVFIIMGILIISFVIFKEVMESNSGVLFRFKELLIKNEVATLSIRKSTNSYYINQILNNPFVGYGLGEKMTLVKQYATVDYGTVWAIDNVFITIGYKLGLSGLVIYSMILINTYIKLLKSKSSQVYRLIYIIPIFLLTVAVVNAQILYNTSISIFMWGYYAVVINQIYCKEIL